MRSLTTFTLVAILAVAATTCFAQDNVVPATNNAPTTTVVDDWSALDQPVDDSYLKAHSPTHGLQSVVAEVRSTLSSLVGQFRVLLGRVNRQEAQIAELQARLHDLDGKSATDPTGTVAAQSTDTAQGEATEADDDGATQTEAAPSDETTTGEQQAVPPIAPTAPVEPEKSAQAGDESDAAPSQEDAGATTEPSPAQTKKAGGDQKVATPKTRLEAVESSVECLNAGQSVLIALIVIMSLVAMIALLRAVRAEKGVGNLAKATHLKLGNDKSLAEGGTFPDDKDVFRDALVEAWLDRGGTPLEPTSEEAEVPPDELAREATEEEPAPRTAQ